MKKNLKLQVALIFLLLTALVIGGCQKEAPIESTEETTDSGFGQAIEFETVHYDDIPLELMVQIESMIAERGFYTFSTEDGMTYLLVSSGEKPTGGYGIEVVSLADYSGEYKALVGEGKPAADAVVPQVITYPYVVIKYATDMTVSEVANEASELFDRLEEPTVTLLTVSGEYQGQIDNSSIEVKVGDDYMVFRNYDFATLLEGIETGDTVTIQYTVNDEAQNMLHTIEK